MALTPVSQGGEILDPAMGVINRDQAALEALTPAQRADLHVFLITAMGQADEECSLEDFINAFIGAAKTKEELTITPPDGLSTMAGSATSIVLWYQQDGQPGFSWMPLGPTEAFDFTAPSTVTFSQVNAGFSLDASDRVIVEY